MHSKAPFASLLLADYGASVLRSDRPHPAAAHTSTSRSTSTSTSTPFPSTVDPLTRHKSCIALDLKNPGGLSFLKNLLSHVDILIDPFRLGILESLDLAPAAVQLAHPRLIIARLTGFRRDGKYAHIAGHDINYLAVSGVLSMLGPSDDNRPPYPPANLLADFAGGGLMCAFGILMALLDRGQSGRGQVVQNNMVDGTAYLASFLRYARKSPLGDQPRGQNMLDGGCPWYGVYECKDGGYMAVGALEPQFFRTLLRGLDLDSDPDFAIPSTSSPSSSFLLATNRTLWPTIKSKFTRRFLTKTRAEWELIFSPSGTLKDACCTPVLTQSELEATDYDQRLPVGLQGEHGLRLTREQAWESRGLVPGGGGDGGGEALLRKWAGWEPGREYEYQYHGGGERRAGSLIWLDRNHNNTNDNKIHGGGGDKARMAKL